MKKPYHRTPSESTKAPLMAKTQAKHIPDGENEGIRILGFTEHEVELVLMSVQCMKRSKRFAVGWEVGYVPRIRPCKRATESLTFALRRLE